MTRLVIGGGVMDSTDWREHDGCGLPVPVGTIVEARRRDGICARFPAGCGSWVGDSALCLPRHPLRDWRRCTWHWALDGNLTPSAFHIVAYRVPRPAGLAALDGVLERLPDTVPAPVPAEEPTQ